MANQHEAISHSGEIIPQPASWAEGLAQAEIHQLIETLDQGAKEDDCFITHPTLRILAESKHTEALTVVRRFLKHEDAALRQASLDALAKSGTLRKQDLEQTLTDEHPLVRWRAVLAIDQSTVLDLSREESRVMVASKLGDPDPEVRGAAALIYFDGRRLRR